MQQSSVLSFSTRVSLLFLLLQLIVSVNAAGDDKDDAPSVTTTASGSSYTGPAAFDPTTLNAPPVPVPPPPTSFNVELQTAGTFGASIAQKGNFFGFSIEFSVIDLVCEYFLCVAFPVLTRHVTI